MNEANDKNEKNWLIKSSSRILGPFTTAEVGQMLSRKYVSIIDEVRQPQSRWGYIREHTIFADLVKNLRNEQAHAMEETVNTTSTTQTVSKTDWTPDNPTPTPVLRANTPEPLLKDVTQSAKSSIGISVSDSSFGSLADVKVYDRIEKKSGSLSLVMWSVAFIFVAGALLYSYQRSRSGASRYDDFIKQALHFNHIQLYDEAVGAYKSAQELKEIDPRITFELALPLIQSERQSLLVRRVLEEGLNNPKTTHEQLIDAYLGIGLSYVLEDDFKMAMDFFNKTVGMDADNLPARINITYNLIKKGDAPTAMKNLKTVMPTSTFQPYITLGTGLVAADSKSIPHEDIEDRLKLSLSNSQPLRKELGLILAYLYMMDKNVDGLKSTMEALIAMPIAEASDFVRDPRIDERVYGWDYLEKYCSEIYERTPKSTLTQSFRAICLLEENRDGEAKHWIDEALAENPKDPYANLTYAHFLIKNRQLPEALTLLQNQTIEKLKVAFFLAGRVCERLNDISCAQEKYEIAFRRKPDDISFLTAWARISMNTENLSPTWGLVKRGMEIQPLYRPLIQLRDRLENP